MTAAELFEIVQGTERVWREEIHFWCEQEWRFLGSDWEEKPAVAARYILGCMVEWLGERDCEPILEYTAAGRRWGIWRHTLGDVVEPSHETQLAACAEAVRTLLREEATR